MENSEEVHQPTNSERLFLILHALTGDSDAGLWRINAVPTLANAIRTIGLKETEDPEALEAISQALYQTQQMLNMLTRALSGLPEYLPRLRSPEAIVKLKGEWEADPAWDIETTGGFEAHAEDLLTYRLQFELERQRVRATTTANGLQSLAGAQAPFLPRA